MNLQQSDKSRDSEGFLALFYCGCNLLVVAIIYATARKSVHILFFVATKLRYFEGYLKSNLPFVPKTFETKTKGLQRLHNFKKLLNCVIFGYVRT